MPRKKMPSETSTQRPPGKLLDEAARGRLALAISVGCCLDTAAALIGVALRAVTDEVTRDAALRQQLETAEATCEFTHLKNLHDAAQDAQWRASTWLLERRFPQRYQKRPAGALTQGQLQAMLDAFTAILVEAIPESTTRAAALSRLDAALRAACDDGEAEIGIASIPGEAP